MHRANLATTRPTSHIKGNSPLVQEGRVVASTYHRLWLRTQAHLWQQRQSTCLARSAASARSRTRCDVYLVAGSLQKALRQSDLPQIGATTISRMLHEEDYRFNLKRTRQDSNPQPLDPKSSALSIELLVHYRNSTI